MMSTEAQVISLASEGVPIGCIARAFRLDRGRLKMIVDEGLAAGLIAEPPAADWFNTRFDDRPKVGAAPAEERPVPTRRSVLLTRYGIGGRHADLLLELIERELLPADEAVDRFTNTGSIDVLRNILGELRRLIEKDKLSIRCERGRGYLLPVSSRARLKAIFLRAGCDE